MYKYLSEISGYPPKTIARELDRISLQNVGDKYFTINSIDPTKPTYVELAQKKDLDLNAVKLWIRTKRAPKSRKNINLEPDLQKIINDFQAYRAL